MHEKPSIAAVGGWRLFLHMGVEIATVKFFCDGGGVHICAVNQMAAEMTHAAVF
jgi:hypothetical protein